MRYAIISLILYQKRPCAPHFWNPGTKVSPTQVPTLECEVKLSEQPLQVPYRPRVVAMIVDSLSALIFVEFVREAATPVPR